MTRITALSVAAAFGFAATLAAQTTTSTATTQRDRMNDKGNEVTITGCLARGADDKFMLNDARMEKSATTTTAGSTTTGTTGTESAGAREHAMTWRLEGGSDLDRHVGHKIQVTGHTDYKESDRTGSNPPTTTTTGTTGTTSTAEAGQRRSTTTDMNQPKLDVTSVKMIASSCS